MNWIRFVSLLFFLCCAWIYPSFAQSSLRISVFTCGTGEDLYASYGHSAIRVIDSMKQTDIVYNYGTFNFGDPDFYIKFTRGKLPYYLASDDYESFIRTYEYEKRSVYEQVLNLSEADAQIIHRFLIENLKPENREYRYDFLFDNCTTRIRDLLQHCFGKRVEFGQVFAEDSVSFRTVLDYYERNLHWERFGINLLMSHQVDQKMNKSQSLFLPDYLMKGLSTSTLDGHPLIRETLQILPGDLPFSQTANQPKQIFWVLCVIIILISFSPKLKKFLVYFDVLFFMILGLLGCFMLFMWFGTEHQVCAWNRNLFWAFPLHLIFAILIPLQSPKVALYARYSSWLIIISLIYSLFAEQPYMSEITPLIFLILVRLSSYSKSVRMASFNPKFFR
ncbi:MAG: DUF4105 domain-containing protein [Chitinophagaceae bacterium]|nr:DUF4105 domain-containing protein [Chitinophagaceae bacterium]